MRFHRRRPRTGPARRRSPAPQGESREIPGRLSRMIDRCRCQSLGRGRPAPAILLKGALAAVAVLALARPAWAEDRSGTCEVRFRGTSTLHDFEGNARCRPFRLAVEPAAGGKAVIGGAEVEIPAGEMDTGNRTRDRQMLEMLQSDRFPRIRANFGTIDAATIRRELQASAQAKVPLDFTLTIRDVARPVHAMVRNFREAGAQVSFDVEYALSLKDFRLPPPRAFFGLVRVGDSVQVTTAVRLEGPVLK